jgi:shikimate kinase
MDNVFLTGFMGTGKTAVGRALARRLSRRFVDLDDEIERSCGMSIAELFVRLGEPEFRRRERAALERATALDGAIVAAGGGAVVDPANRATMRAHGIVVCLTAAAETILQRIGDARERPLLANAADRAERVRQLLDERAPAYADAELTIDTTGRGVQHIVESIANRLSMSPKVAAGGAAGAGKGSST